MKKQSIFLFLILLQLASNAQWKSANLPYRADVNSAIHDPAHNNQVVASFRGRVFTSSDNGDNWTYAGIGAARSYGCLAVLDNTLFVASNPGLYFSVDNAKTWTKNATFPDGITINAMVSKGNSLYIGTLLDGIYYSTNKGDDWLQVFPNSLSNKGIRSLCFNDSTLFAATVQGVFTSTDGSNWKEKNNGLPVSPYAIDFAVQGKTVLTVVSNTVYASSDNGDNWKVLDKSTAQWKYISSLAADESTIFVGTDDGVYVSKDKGNSWVKSSVGLPSQSTITTLTLTPNGLFAGTLNGIFFSPDKGLTWQDKNNKLPATEVYTLLSLGTRLFTGGHGDISLSEDNGKTWNSKFSPITDFAPHTFRLLNHDAGIFAAINGNIFLSADQGNSWKMITKNTPDDLAVIYELVKEQKTLYALKSLHGIYTSVDDGTTWKRIAEDLSKTLDINCIAVNATSILIGGYNGGIYISPDKGLTWENITNGISSNLRITTVALIDNTLYAGSIKGLFRSTDLGKNWALVSDATLQTARIQSIKETSVGIFVGTENNLFFSKDQGITWVSIEDGLPNVTVKDITIHENFIFAALDGGGIWYRPLSDIITGINENKNENTFLIYPNPGNGLFTLLTTSKSAYVKVFNTIGACVFQSDLNNSNSQIDLGALPTGMYVVSIVTKDGKRVSRKLAIQ